MLTKSFSFDLISEKVMEIPLFTAALLFTSNDVWVSLFLTFFLIPLYEHWGLISGSSQSGI